MLGVKGAPYKKGLFRIARDKADLILAVGDKDPLDPARKILSVDDIHADRPDRVAIHVTRSWGFGKTGSALFSWVDGRLRHVYTGEEDEAIPWASFLNPTCRTWLSCGAAPARETSVAAGRRALHSLSDAGDHSDRIEAITSRGQPTLIIQALALPPQF